MTTWRLRNLVTTDFIQILHKATQERAPILQISHYDISHDGDIVKGSFIATRVFFVPFISLLLFGIATWKFPPFAVAQSLVLDDVKHDTPGRVIKQGQAVHIDVDLALVNVTVTDPYNLNPALLETEKCNNR